jgi:hypothetical protein
MAIPLYAIGGYSINRYWWLFHCKPLVVILLMVILLMGIVL